MFKCEDCGREFTNRDSAILHRKQHNNERTHWCQDCGKGFFKASCLQVRRKRDLSMFYDIINVCHRGTCDPTREKSHITASSAIEDSRKLQH